MRKKGEISGPLPLPVGFTLLPSLLPGRQLTPFLYIELNTIPIYLLISPSHEPHLSFLSILLALKPKSLPNPLSIFLKYGLGGNGKVENSTLDGVAPWADIWVPLPLARRILRETGAARLFWSSDGRGLLGDVDDAVSWEEDGGWSHNWLPSKSHLPVSSYSLDNLLTSKWPLVEIIPKQRCIHTPAGSQRLARLTSDGLYGDPSTLRHGPFIPVWDGLIEWTYRSWKQYQAAPSKLSPTPTSSGPRKSQDPMISAIESIPSLFNSDLSANHLLSLNQTDISRLFPSSVQVFSASALFMQIINIIWELCLRAVPGADELRTMAFGPGSKDLEQTRTLARVNLALCSLVWDIVIGIWRLGRENEQLRKLLKDGGGAATADIALSPRVDSGSTTSRTRRTRWRQQSSPSESEEEQMDRLERKRGGSPPRHSRPLKPRSAGDVSRDKGTDTFKGDQSRGGASPSKKPSASGKENGTTRQHGQGDNQHSPIAGEQEETDTRHAAGQRPTGGNGITDVPDASLTTDAEQVTHLRDPSRTPRRSQHARRMSARHKANGTDPDQAFEDLSDESGGHETLTRHRRFQGDDGPDREDVGVFARIVVNPVMFGVLAMMVYVWWRRDPPEPAVVVL